MKILLVITNTARKSEIVISNTLKVLTLDAALHRAKNGEFKDVFVVRGKYGDYLRSLPNTSTKDNIDTLSVTAVDIMAYANSTRHFKSTDTISIYVAHYQASLLEVGKPYIETHDGHKAFVDQVRDLILLHTSLIKQAARQFSIDPYLLGAIVIDESVRLGAFEEVVDSFLLSLIGRNVSVGIAQVKLETANNLIQGGFYNPNPRDKKIPFINTLSNDDRRYLYPYVSEPKHNLRFAAAFIQSIISKWSKYIDLSDRPEIIGTLYNQGYGDPKKNPTPNRRGEQIAGEFYDYTKQWF